MKVAGDDDLLVSAFVMSAGLSARFGKKFVARQFHALNSQLARSRRLHRRLLSGRETIRFSGLNDIAVLLQNFRSERVILAASLFGPALVSFAALTSVGAKVATIYWAMSEAHRQVVDACSIHAIDMTRQTNRLSFIRLLQELHADGYVIWLMCDAPGESRIRHNFLEYSVCCAHLIEVYARVNRCTVIPTYCRVLSDEDASLHCDAPLTDYNNLTQRLLSNLEAMIYQDPINYLWSGRTIIFSDPRAIVNGVHCLPDFLAWREVRCAE
jgi:hypothetical protein